MTFIVNVFAAALCGALSGVGIGGGTLLLLYMTAVARLPQTTAQGINLLYFIPAAASAVYFHWKNGLVDKKALVPTALSGLVCSAAAAFAANSIEPELLRRIFGGFLILCGSLFLFKKTQK